MSKTILTKAAFEQIKADKRRLDWLETMVVEVRRKLVYGSREIFLTSPADEDNSPSEIRRQIDEAMKAQKKESK